MKDFEQLLYKESIIQKFQTKIRKFLNKGHIEVLDKIYNFKSYK